MVAANVNVYLSLQRAKLAALLSCPSHSRAEYILLSKTVSETPVAASDTAQQDVDATDGMGAADQDSDRFPTGEIEAAGEDPDLGTASISPTGTNDSEDEARGFVKDIIDYDPAKDKLLALDPRL
jgi:hypothetical protein